MKQRIFPLMLVAAAMLVLPLQTFAQTLRLRLTDRVTSEPAMLINVSLMQTVDGSAADSDFMRTSTDFDGFCQFKNLEVGKTYRVAVSSMEFGDTQFPVILMDSGFVRMDVLLTPKYKGIPGIVIDDGSSAEHRLDKIRLQRYRVVNKDLKRMLHRAVGGRYCTYWGRLNDKVSKDKEVRKWSYRGRYYELTYHSPDTAYDYIRYLQRTSTGRETGTYPFVFYTLAPQFDTLATSQSFNITSPWHDKMAADDFGYIRYRGRIIFLTAKKYKHQPYREVDTDCLQVNNAPELDSAFFKPTGSYKIFNYGGPKSIGIWDPPTWLYSLQRGFWYVWIEFPSGW